MDYKSPYLTPDSPEAFLDFGRPKFDEEDVETNEQRKIKECPVCRGYGGWNLRTFAYKLPKGMEDNEENRHKHVHFRANCSHCDGWGFVDISENCPGHKWGNRKNIGNCLNVYTCELCGKKWEVDSSG